MRLLTFKYNKSSVQLSKWAINGCSSSFEVLLPFSSAHENNEYSFSSFFSFVFSKYENPNLWDLMAEIKSQPIRSRVEIILSLDPLSNVTPLN